MDIVLLAKAAVMGIVEGLTEFLPISSTGHLILAGSLLGGFGDNRGKVFEIAIQTGAIFAVILVYWQKIRSTVVALPRQPKAQRLALNIFIGFLPAVVLGLLFGKVIKEHLFIPTVVASTFIIGGFIILWAEKRPPGETATDGREVATVRLITAQTPVVRAYRKIGARHIYNKYANLIYKGKLPPLVYAVVVVETDIDATGKVVNVTFSRTPSHAPEVAPKIAEMIKAASPLPNPGKLGAHTYVDTWLWDRSDKFQIDSLTQGQRSR